MKKYLVKKLIVTYLVMNFLYKFGQISDALTLKKVRLTYNLERME